METAKKSLRQQTQQLLDGPLKHVRGAALAAALLPLASVVPAAASVDPLCGSGGVCGKVFNDVDHDGIQEPGELGIGEVKIAVYDGKGDLVFETFTDDDGTYRFSAADGPYTVRALIPPGTQTSPRDAGTDDNADSDGRNTGDDFSTAENVFGLPTSNVSFGFFTTAARNPGTGTPGYWKNHPDAWPVPSITVGGVTYSKKDAIMWLGRVGKDKTTTMFSSLVSAQLNVLMKNDASCVASTIDAANTWMAKYGPVGSNVA